MAPTEIFSDTAGQWRFRIRAGNGEIVAQSQGYTTKAAALKGVAALHANITTTEDGGLVDEQ